MSASEIHVWGSRREDIEHPDEFVMDLDPGPGISCGSQVIEAAEELKEILEGLKLKKFLKVTGGKGLHIHVPIAPFIQLGADQKFQQKLWAKK